MSKRKPPRMRAYNPYTRLRAKTIQSKKKVASKRACRGKAQTD
jgi:hypothetical protein